MSTEPSDLPSWVIPVLIAVFAVAVILPILATLLGLAYEFILAHPLEFMPQNS